MERLLKMLQYKRRHDTRGEELFVKQFIMPYGPEVFLNPKDASILAYVLHVTNGESGVPPVLWSCHVDTVHRAPTDPTGYRQKVKYDADCGMVYKDDGDPLGADDAAGVWLLLEMIDAGVPGTYIFHRGEEVGGIGSSGMADHHKQFLRKYEYAIAFDRRGTEDIITHQAGGRCASESFAHAFADLLNTPIEGIDPLNYKPCDGGIFTDTANYTHIIPECTNVSVGYEDEHTKHELLDSWHLMALRNSLIANFGTGISLPVARDPTIVESKWDKYGDWDKWNTIKVPSKSLVKDDYGIDDEPTDAHSLVMMGYNKVRSWVERGDPAEIADLLMQLAENEVYADERYTEEQDYRDGKWGDWK
jgi:hypothetical protein